jgi:hypothetical protein
MDVNLCKPLQGGRNRGLPVGSFAGADDVPTAYAAAGGESEPDVLLIILIKSVRMLAIMLAAVLLESEFDVVAGGSTESMVRQAIAYLQRR